MEAKTKKVLEKYYKELEEKYNKTDNMRWRIGYRTALDCLEELRNRLEEKK